MLYARHDSVTHQLLGIHLLPCTAPGGFQWNKDDDVLFQAKVKNANYKKQKQKQFVDIDCLTKCPELHFEVITSFFVVVASYKTLEFCDLKKKKFRILLYHFYA